MRLDNIKIKNFRKLKDCTINFRDTTFLIGTNNAGKSSVFKALEFLHQNTNPSRMTIQNITMRTKTIT